MNKQNKVINTDHRTVVARGEGVAKSVKGVEDMAMEGDWASGMST